MKIYELGFRIGDNYDEDHHVVWIKTNGIILDHSAVYCKEIDVKEGLPGIDATIYIE